MRKRTVTVGTGNDAHEHYVYSAHPPMDDDARKRLFDSDKRLPYGPNVCPLKLNAAAKWARENGLVRAGVGESLCYVRKGRCGHGEKGRTWECFARGLGWWDHVSMWRNPDTGRRLFLAQPYVEGPSEETVGELRESGLVVKVTDNGWYAACPGLSVVKFIEISNK